MPIYERLERKVRETVIQPISHTLSKLESGRYFIQLDGERYFLSVRIVRFAFASSPIVLIEQERSIRV